MGSAVRRAVVLTLLFGGACAQAATADTELLDALLANGAITAEQHAKLLAQRDPAATESSGPVVTFDEGGLEIASADADFAINVGARIHADWVRHSDEGADADGIDGTNLRRARIEIDGNLHADWGWAAEVDFADNETSIKDFRLGYEGFDAVILSAGQQKQPYSLALEMSSNDIPFMERSIDNELIAPFVDRAIGARADFSGEHWFAAAGVFGESIDPILEGDEGWGTAARFVYAPIIEDESVVHLGVRAARREPSTLGDEVRLRAGTASFSELYIVDTGPIAGVDAVTLFGPEAAVAFGAVTLLGEFNRATLERASGDDLEFESWHIAGAWAIGGTSRAQAYDIEAGEFKRLDPARNFRRGAGGGAWEIAARIASLDLNDGAFTGGSEKRFTLGANWYANPNLRFMIDWTRVMDTDRSSPVRVAADGLDVLALRAQLAF